MLGGFKKFAYLCNVKMNVLAIRVSFPRGSKTISTLLQLNKEPLCVALYLL